MKIFCQPRVSVIFRCTAALTIGSLTLTGWAQAPAQQPPPSAAASPTAKPHVQPTPATPSRRDAQAADNAYLAGAGLVVKRDLAGAENQFRKAVKLDPANRDYALALALTHQQHVTELVQAAGKARLLGQHEKAETLLAEAVLLDPQSSLVNQHRDPGLPPKAFHPEIEPWIHDAPALAGPITLRPKPIAQSFHLKSDEQDVVRQVLAGYGVRAEFDESVTRENLRFDMDNAPYDRTVPILLNMTHLFAVPLDSTSVIIAKDTAENRQRLERQLQETIYIPGMTNEEMDELGNVVRNVFDVKQLTVEKSAGSLVLRAPQDTMTYINLTLADLIDGGSQVMIELKLYSVNKTNQRNIGAQVPQQIGIYSVASAAGNIVSSNQSLVTQAIAQGLIPAGSSNITIALALIASGLVQSALLTSTVGFFGGGLTQTGVTTNQNLAFNLALTSSDTRALDDIQVRVGNGQTATFRVGERYPITTATYSSGLTGSASALSNVSINGVSAASLLNSASATTATIPEIQYEDLGLTLKATPTVQKSGAIKMHVDLKIESLTGGSLDNIPLLNSQQFTSDVTVDDGETALMASSLNKSETAAISGLPGLGELPGFQTALSDTTTMLNTSSLILLITPHVTRRRSNISAGPRIAINLPEPTD
jgi:general secretion pathway protein D